MKLPHYKYSDLHPKHEAWKLANLWGEKEADEISNKDIDDAIEYILDSLHPTPIRDLGKIEIVGYARDEEQQDSCVEGFAIHKVCIVVVDPYEWAKEHAPDWLEDEIDR